MAFNPRNDRSARRRPYRAERAPVWLVGCEGTKTEPLYIIGLLDWLKEHGFTPPEIDVVGCGMNTKSLVDEVVTLRARGTVYEKTFVLFDHDEFPAEHFNTAIQRADAQGIVPIWSNESFELWLYLHFQYCESRLHRDQYCDLLSRELGYKYNKADEEVVRRLMEDDNISQAIQRAKKLEKLCCHHRSHVNRNPATEMYLLAEQILDKAGYGKNKEKQNM